MTSKDLDWSAFNKNMPLGKDAESVAHRKKFFRVCDINGNGLISLAEYDRGLRTFIGSGTLSQQLFAAKPAIQRAFHAARRADQSSDNKRSAVKSELGGNLAEDDYVSRKEFRTLIAYTRQFFELWLMFISVDTGGANFVTGGETAVGDRRISSDEFAQAVPQLERWGAQLSDAAEEFARIDADGSGFIRFDEFASWALSKKLDLEDDDDPDDVEALLTVRPEFLTITDADTTRREALKARREDGASCAGYSNLYAARQMVSPRATDPPPEPPSTVRRRMLEASTTSPTKRKAALCTLGQYNAQYQARMLNDMRAMQRNAAALGAVGRLGISTTISRYDAERLLSLLEAGPTPFVSLVPTPSQPTSVPSLPPSLEASLASVVGSDAPASARAALGTLAPLSPLTPESRSARQRRVADNAHRALQRSQPDWAKRAGLNPPGRTGASQHWLMSDVMARSGSAASGGGKSGGGTSGGGLGATSPRREWPAPLQPAVRPRTVLVDQLSRLDPLTMSASRLRYTPSARLRASEELVPMRFEPSRDRV